MGALRRVESNDLYKHRHLLITLNAYVYLGAEKRAVRSALRNDAVVGYLVYIISR